MFRTVGGLAPVVAGVAGVAGIVAGTGGAESRLAPQGQGGIEWPRPGGAETRLGLCL